MLVLDYDQIVAIVRKHDQLSHGTSLSVEKASRDEGWDWEMAKACEEAMGPNGNGFVAVSGTRNYVSLRSRLLSLARRLALMPNSERAIILREHGLGTDVPLKDPGRSVSSFAAQLRFGCPSDSLQLSGCLLSGLDAADLLQTGLPSIHGSLEEHSFSDLGGLFKELGMCMIEVGLLVARLCDASQSHGSMREGKLEQAILESGTAKGRLIHYHSRLEQITLSSLNENLHKGPKPNKSARGGKKSAGIASVATDSVSTRWQQWHCDYGIFTVLTSPVFLKPTRLVPWNTDDVDCGLENVQECAPPDGHSSLIVMDSHGRSASVVVPSDYLIVQVGEAAQLLSGGKLVARAHCVMRPTAAEDVSRETMAVFLQPAWDKRMSLPPGIPPERTLEAGGLAAHLQTHIPLLASRWKEGCTFAELSKETTRQYYGADGHQTRR